MTGNLTQVNKCIEKNCSAELKHFSRDYDKYKQKLYQINEDVLNQNISFSEAQKRIKNATIRMFNLRDRVPLGKCQLQHCYKETYALINGFLRHYKRQLIQKIMFANKYLKVIKKGLTYKNLLKYDVDSWRMSK